MNAWTWAATGLVLALVPLALVTARRPAVDSLVALEVAGTTTAVALLLVAEGTSYEVLADLALLLGVGSTIGAGVLLRFLGEPG